MSAVTPLEVQRLGRLHDAWRNLIRRNGGIENTLAVLNAAEPQQKTPLVAQRGSGRTANRPAEKDMTNMTAVPLFAKEKEAPPPRKAGRVTETQQLESWLRQGRDEVFWVQASVTPELASALLANNPENRAVVNRIVDDYAAAMRRGEWHMNGQDIIIANTGELNDGQKRLLAVIDAGMTVEMGLKFGVERVSRSTLDVGQKRSLGDHLAMRKYPNANLLAAVVRLAWCYDNGIYSLSQAPSVQQALQYTEADPRIQDFLRVGVKIGSEFGTSGAQFAFAAFVCSRVDYGLAERLANQIQNGLGLTAANLPASRVRDRLLQHGTGRVPLRRNEPAAIFIKAFNAALSGRRMRALAWTNSGQKAEPFPIAGA